MNITEAAKSPVFEVTKSHSGLTLNSHELSLRVTDYEGGLSAELKRGTVPVLVTRLNETTSITLEERDCINPKTLPTGPGRLAAFWEYEKYNNFGGAVLRAEFQVLDRSGDEINWQYSVSVTLNDRTETLTANNDQQFFEHLVKTTPLSDFSGKRDKGYVIDSELSWMRVGNKMVLCPAKVELPERPQWDKDLKRPAR